MGNLYSAIHSVFEVFVQYCILGVELIGIVVLIGSVIRAVIGLIKNGKHLRLQLAEGIAFALELKLAGELLRTLIVREWSELLQLGAIILLRATLSLLIHWEISAEKKAHKENDSTEQNKENN